MRLSVLKLTAFIERVRGCDDDVNRTYRDGHRLGRRGGGAGADRQAGNAGQRGGRGAAADVANGSASCAGARCRGPPASLPILRVAAQAERQCHGATGEATISIDGGTRR